ncbi:MAG: glycosyltransferase [Planctomycetia bacterium]|nr:glycosyltransferase [Planctomycetia bacterium]
MTRHALLVLGMHRSGTSALTRVLGLMGAALPHEPMPPTADNPQGYWESRRIARLNNRLLESAGTSWSDDAAISPEWFADPGRGGDREEAVALLAEEFAAAPAIVLKDPRICRLVPFWKAVLDAAGLETRAVLALRDPLEVARSLAARDADPAFRPAAIPDLARGLLLWLRSVLDAEWHTRELTRHVIDYADLLRDWRMAVGPLDDIMSHSRLSADSAAAIDTFLDPTLRRQAAGDTEPSLPGLARLRALLDSIKDGPVQAAAACDEARADLERLSLLHPRTRAGSDVNATSDPRAAAILAGMEAAPRHSPYRSRSILFLSGAPASIGHVYRVLHPIEALDEHGWQTAWLPADSPDTLARLDTTDVVTIFRCPWTAALEAIVIACRRRGIPVVYDIDDLIFDPEVMETGAFGYLDTLPDAERRQWITIAADYRRALCEADAAVLTTPSLTAAARPHCPRVFVLPNGHSPAMFAAAAVARSLAKPSASDGRPRLGFASGTPTHQRDFAVIAPAIARLFSRRSEPLLTIVGYLDVAAFPALADHASRIEVRPHVPFVRLPEEVARFDINLAPLEVGNPFCEAKSPIRCTTAATVAVPSVASPTAPLRDALVDGETGFLAADTAAWERAFDCLLDDPALRRQMGEAAHAFLIARMGWPLWSGLADAVYTAVLREHVRRPRAADEGTGTARGLVS